MSAPMVTKKSATKTSRSGRSAGQRLVRVVRPVDEEAGQERAQRQGEAGGLGERRGAEPHREGHEQEHLVAVHARHPRHERRDELGRHVAGRHQDEQRPCRGCAAMASSRPRLERAQGGDEHDQDHHREVLDEA